VSEQVALAQLALLLASTRNFQEEVGSNNFCAEPVIESGTDCDMCQGSGPLTNPSNIIENGVWQDFACQTVQDAQEFLDISTEQCDAAKQGPIDFCGCDGTNSPSPPSNGPIFCFSGQTKVFVKDQGEVLMSNLRLAGRRGPRFQQEQVRTCLQFWSSSRDRQNRLPSTLHLKIGST
jgi:hypothetical protein